MTTSTQALRRDRALGALLGLACGDAVGTTVEFEARGSFAPVTDMVGGGPFSLAAGQWTDDTSMALCLATSLVHRDGFDPVDQMNRYVNWWQWGYLSSTGECFDSALEVGMLCRAHCFGNGLIMRAVGDRMIIAPPMVMTLAQVDEMVALILKCLDLTQAELKQRGWL